MLKCQGWRIFPDIRTRIVGLKAERASDSIRTGTGGTMEYALTTAHDISGSIAHSLGGSITQALNGVTGQMQPLAPQVRSIFDWMLNNPVGTAIGVGVLALLVGLMLAQRR
jgi:hypothetical protein